MMFTRRHILVGSAAASLVVMSPASATLNAFKPAGSGRFEHGAFDALLKTHVRPDGNGYNRINYSALKADKSKLDAVILSMTAIDPRSLSRSQAHAYWINLYNAVTLQVVVSHWPVGSIKKINLGGNGLFGSGPWKAKLVTVSGVELSLDDIEHEIVRPLFNDPLSHYGLNCASYSCPNLMPAAYTGDNLTQLLEANARDYINHNRGVSIAEGSITASNIYKWYGDDFGGRSKLKAHWQAYATPEKAKAIAAARIGDFIYDWSINAT